MYVTVSFKVELDATAHVTQNEAGKALAQQHRKPAQEGLEAALSLSKICTEREQSAPGSKQEQPEWLQAGLDGGWLPSREHKAGMEGKIGVVAAQVEAGGKHGRHRLTRWRSVATFGSADELGMLTSAAACDRGAISRQATSRVRGWG